MLLFLGVCRTVPCSASLENFVGVPHIARICPSPEFLPSGGIAQVELTRRRSCVGLSIHRAKFHHGKPRWFVLWLLLASCDVERCPGPKYSEPFCVVCCKPVISEGIRCNACHKLCHPKCAWVSDEEYQRLQVILQVTGFVQLVASPVSQVPCLNLGHKCAKHVARP